MAKPFIAVAVVLLAAGAGCTRPAPDTSPPDARQQEALAAPEPDIPPVQLVFGPLPAHEIAYRQFFQGLIDSFNAAQNRIVVTGEFVPESIGDFDPAYRAAFWEKWTGYAAGNARDVLVLPRDSIPELALQGRITSVSGYLLLNKDIEADFLPGQLESVRFDDKYYGLPMTWTSYVFMVNEAIINPRSMAGVEELDPRLPYAEAVAVPPPPHMEPATWDEMLEMIEWCRGSAFNRGTHFFIVDWPPTLVWLWQTLALQKGAEIITRDGQVDLHHPAVLDAFDQLHAWRKARRPFLMEWPVPFHTDAPYYERIPTQSDHWFTKICGLDVFRDSSTLDNTRPYSHMAPMPATAGGGDAILADSVDMPVWNYVFLVPNGATDIEQAAWEFADWASTSDVLAATLANEFYPMMPARRSVLDNPLFGLDTNFQRRQALADYPRYVRWPLVPGLTEVRTILEAGFRRAWKDWESADHAAEIFVEVEQEANDAIARARFAASNAQ